jgi:hypothetical protein
MEKLFNKMETGVTYLLAGFVLVMWSMLVFHMITEGVVATQFGIYG